MNWYKTIKVALPIMDAPVGSHYTSVGHNFDKSRDIEEELWMIDRHWKLHTGVPTYKNRLHYTMFSATVANAYLAKGRYEVTPNGEKKVSLTINAPGSSEIAKQGALKNKVVKILDQHYGNPTIYEF
jgi:hypothetical protein